MDSASHYAGISDRLLGDSRDDGRALFILACHDGLYFDRHLVGRARLTHLLWRALQGLSKKGLDAFSLSAPKEFINRKSDTLSQSMAGRPRRLCRGTCLPVGG